MTPFSMVVWIVAICVFGSIAKKHLDKKHAVKPETDNDTIEKLIAINEELNSNVKALEARVISLEAIVTDEGYELKQKISGL